MDNTPFLNLTKMYLQDFADKRVDNLNWDILDRWAGNHSHGGQDSSLIDLGAIWEAIEELRRKDIIHENRMRQIEILSDLRYREYIKHRHYSLTAPPSINTSWFDTFKNYAQINKNFTTATLNTVKGYAKLPFNYTNRQNYYVVFNPIDILQDDNFVVSEAVVKLIMAKKGIVTPLLKIGNGVTVLPAENTKRIIPGVIAGAQNGYIEESTSIVSRYSFANKKMGDNTNPNYAFHHVDLFNKRPTLSRFGAGYVHDIEFNDSDYVKIADKNGASVTTGPRYQDAVAVYKKVPVSKNIRPLHNNILKYSVDEQNLDDTVLSWDEETNTFYWMDTDGNTFTQINKQDIAPLVDKNMVQVAAERDPSTKRIWILKTRTVPTENPVKTFSVQHQFVSWDGSKDFVEYEWWTSATKMDRRNWPARVIAPNKLIVDQDNIHAIVELDPTDILQNGKIIYNYYEGNESYQWFPFVKLYGQSFNFSNSVKFAYFNPGILGTINTIPKKGDLKAKGPSKFIRGAYSPTQTSFAMIEDLGIEQFEGGNTKIFLGENLGEIFFYQSFVNYNGSQIKSSESWKDPIWIGNNPDASWNGVVAYNIKTGQSRYIRENVPFLANTSGGIDGDSIALSGGIELVKQFVTSDNRVLGTVDNKPPANTSIKYSYWIDKHIPGVSLARGASLRDDIISPYHINISDNSVSRETSSVDPTDGTSVNSRINGAKMVVSPKGFSTVGGSVIENRSAIRARPVDQVVRTAVQWHGSIIDGQVARQVFRFSVGSFIEESDIVKIKFNTRSEGVPITEYVYSPARADVRVYRFSYSGGGSNTGTRSSAWSLIGNINNDTPEREIVVNGNDIIENRQLWLMFESQRQSNKKRKIASRLITDYVEVTVEKNGYIYTYNWSNLPSGNKAGLVLECSTSGLPDVNGVEVHSADLSIISSPVTS